MLLLLSIYAYAYTQTATPLLCSLTWHEDFYIAWFSDRTCSMLVLLAYDVVRFKGILVIFLIFHSLLLKTALSSRVIDVRAVTRHDV